MRESAFRAFLSGRLGGRSIDSYLAYCSRTERELSLDLDTCDLDDAGLANMAQALAREGVPPASLRNMISASRSYRDFRQSSESGAAQSAAKLSMAPKSRGPRPGSAAPTVPLTPPPERPPLIRSASVRDLLITHGQIMDELRHRGVVRTGNGPVGDYAELLFAQSFGWTLAGNSSTGYDATDQAGVRYQIKCRRVTARNPSRQLSALRRLEAKSFDVLAGVLLDEAYDVRRAILIPHACVVAHARWTPHTNSWRFLLEDRIWDLPDAQDVTQALRQTAHRMA